MTAAPKMTRFRWVICGLLFFACLINYMDRQILGLLKPELAKKYDWSETDYSRMVIFFQIAYAIGQTAFGPFITWLGTKRAYSVSILLWSGAAMSHALARSVGSFCGARFALGLGESGNFPTAIRTVTEWFPAKERSIATGIFNAGSNIGAVFAPFLVPLLAIKFGWQAAFISLGCVDLVWLAFWLGLYAAPEKSTRVNAEELAHIRQSNTMASEQRIPWTKLFGYREAWAYYGTCVLVGPVWWFYGFWLPDFFNKQFHLNLKQFGLPLILIYSITCLGSIFGGGLSALFLRWGWSINRARKSATFLCAIMTIPVIFAPRVESVWLAAGFFAMAAAAHQGWSATMYTAVSDIFPKSAVASIVGFGGTLASVISTGLFWYVGHSLQQQHDEAYKSIMLICGSAYVLAWLIFHIGVPVIKPAKVQIPAA